MTAWDSMRGSRYLAEDPLAHPPTQMALLLLSWCLVLSPCYLYFLRLGGHRGDIVKGRPASVGGWVRERREEHATDHTSSSQASGGFHSNPHNRKSSFQSYGTSDAQREQMIHSGLPS